MEQQTKKRNWEEIMIETDTMVTHELLLACEEENWQEVKKGLKLYHEACIAGAKIELWDHLHYLMQDVILVKFLEEYRTQEHWEKICRLRSKIEDDLEYNDFLTEKNIKEEWNSAFKSGRGLAETYAKQASELTELTWNEVFEQSYHPSNYGKEG